MSNAGGTTYGFVIQGRSIIDIPVVLKDGPMPLVLTKERWTTIPTHRVPDGWGVQSGLWCSIASEHGMLSYAAATALMGKMATDLTSGRGIQFRLLKQKLPYEWKIEDVGSTEPFTFAEREQAETIHPLSVLPDKA